MTLFCAPSACGEGRPQMSQMSQVPSVLGSPPRVREGPSSPERALDLICGALPLARRHSGVKHEQLGIDSLAHDGRLWSPEIRARCPCSRPSALGNCSNREDDGEIDRLLCGTRERRWRVDCRFHGCARSTFGRRLPRNSKPAPRLLSPRLGWTTYLSRRLHGSRGRACTPMVSGAGHMCSATTSEPMASRCRRISSS